MASTSHTFLPLLLIMGLAFLVPVALSRLRWLKIPAVVLELACGILIGRSGLRAIETNEVLSFLSLFGFIYLMFLSGLEIDFRSLQAQLRRPARGRASRNLLPRAALLFFLTAATSLGVAWLLVSLGLGTFRSLPLLALILCTTSVGLVMPTLREGAHTGTRFGQAVLLSAVLADVVTIVVLGSVVVLLTDRPLWELMLVVVFGLVLLLSVKIGRLLTSQRTLGRLLENLTPSSPQIRVRGALALLLVFVGLTEVIGLEVILGAFMAGALISGFVERDRGLLEHKLDALGYGFFVPVFFIMVGVTFDASVLTGGWHTLMLLGVLIPGAYLVKVLPSLIAFTGMLGRRHALAAGVLLSSRLSLIIAVSAIGHSLGLVSSELNSAVILLAMVTCVVSPALFVRLVRRPTQVPQRVVIGGGGRIGRALASRLAAQNTSVLVIERDAEQLHKLEPEIPRMIGDITSEADLRRAGISSSDRFVAITGSDEVNLAACQLARDIGSPAQLVARDENPDSTARFLENGIVPLDRTGSLALTLENLVLRPSLLHLLVNENPGQKAFEIRVAQVPPRHRFIRDFGDFHETLFVAVRRGDEVVFPHGDTELVTGDRLVAFGSEDDQAMLSQLLGTPAPTPASAEATAGKPGTATT